MTLLHRTIRFCTLFLLINNLCWGKNESRLRVGKTINVFVRYGYLEMSIKVISDKDTEQYLFKAPTYNIFRGIEQLVEVTEENQSGGFHGDFHMEFCDNKTQLFEAYFRDFTIEGLEYPWRAFIGSWLPEVAAQKFGINLPFIEGDYCYVLVRMSRFRETARLTKPIPANQMLYEEVSTKIHTMKPGNSTETSQFITNFGTHYINSYVTGNSLYQVFVYSKQKYQYIKDRLKTRTVAAISRLDLYNYFAPWYAEHLGQIRAASGNSRVEAWANRKLRLSYYIFTYVSLLKLHGNGNSNLLRQLDNLLGNEAILSLDLRTITTPFKEPKKRQWFQEIIDNYLKLWEINMQGMNDFFTFS